MRWVPIEIKETENQITIRAEVPGFTADEIKVSVEPKWLVISGKSEKTTEEKKEQTVCSELRSNQFCRELTLPAEVDPAKTSANLKDGILELVLAKTAEPKSVNVEVKTQ
jgi:HSP20 family protein